MVAVTRLPPPHYDDFIGGDPTGGNPDDGNPVGGNPNEDDSNEDDSVYNGVLIVDLNNMVVGYRSEKFPEDGIIEIPEVIIGIREKAFYRCMDLKSVKIGGSVSIEDNAFFDCENLESVTIGGSLDRVGDSAFEMCINLKSVTIGYDVKDIDEEK